MIKEIILETIKGETHLGDNLKEQCIDYIEVLEQENKQLKDQIEYLINGEYINQLRLERDLLQDLVYEGELSKEVYDIVKIAKDNTRLAEHLQQRDEVIEEAMKFINETWWYEDDYEEDKTYLKDEFCVDKILEILQKYKGDNK